MPQHLCLNRREFCCGWTAEKKGRNVWLEFPQNVNAMGSDQKRTLSQVKFRWKNLPARHTKDLSEAKKKTGRQAADPSRKVNKKIVPTKLAPSLKPKWLGEYYSPNQLAYCLCYKSSSELTWFCKIGLTLTSD